MILQRGKAVSGWAGALFGGSRRSGQLRASQAPATGSFAPAPGRLQLGAASEPRSGRQSGPQIQNDSFNKYDFGFYIWI